MRCRSSSASLTASVTCCAPIAPSNAGHSDGSTRCRAAPCTSCCTQAAMTVACALALRLEASWLDMLREGTSHFEQHDARLGRALSATLRRVPSGGPHQGPRQIDLAVIVLSDVTQLLSIQADLRQLNEQLEARIEARTSELNVSRAELSRLSGQLMSAQEDDRRRIAQELHDSIGQSLGAIKYSLERAVQMNRAQDIALTAGPPLIDDFARSADDRVGTHRLRHTCARRSLTTWAPSRRCAGSAASSGRSIRTSRFTRRSPQPTLTSRRTSGRRYSALCRRP